MLQHSRTYKINELHRHSAVSRLSIGQARIERHHSVLPRSKAAFLAQVPVHLFMLLCKISINRYQYRSTYWLLTWLLGYCHCSVKYCSIQSFALCPISQQVYYESAVNYYQDSVTRQCNACCKELWSGAGEAVALTQHLVRTSVGISFLPDTLSLSRHSSKPPGFRDCLP